MSICNIPKLSICLLFDWGGPENDYGTGGEPDEEYLLSLGAKKIVVREEFSLLIILLLVFNRTAVIVVQMNIYKWFNFDQYVTMNENMLCYLLF